MVTDTIKEVAGIPYVEARAVFFDGEGKIEVTAQAGIDPNRKGMDIAQSFGSSSSYARKYKKWLNVNTPEFNKAKDFIKGGGSLEQIEAKYKLAKETKELLIK